VNLENFDIQISQTRVFFLQSALINVGRVKYIHILVAAIGTEEGNMYIARFLKPNFETTNITAVRSLHTTKVQVMLIS